MLLMYFALYLKSSFCEKVLCDTSISEMSLSEMSFNEMLFSEMSSCDVDLVNCGRSWRITIDAIDATESPFQTSENLLAQ